jgi:hypothetical protein
MSMLASPSLAQELEPRRWSHLPTGYNFAAAGYTYTEANIALDPALAIENATKEVRTWAAGYIRSFQLFDKSARVDLAQAYKKGRWAGLLNGEATSVRRSGWADSIVRFAINLYGAPPLADKEYAAYRAKTEVETIIGTALVVQLPTGHYLKDKLINLGTNRFTFRPELGVVHSRGNWSFEATGTALLYTDNDEFFNGNRLEQDPLFTLEGHAIYTFRPGLWAATSVGYQNGGQSTVNGAENNDRKKYVNWALSFGYPFTRDWGIKAAYLGSRTAEPVGLDSDTFLVSLATFW